MNWQFVRIMLKCVILASGNSWSRFFPSIRGQKVTKVIYLFIFQTWVCTQQQHVPQHKYLKSLVKSFEACLDGGAHLWYLLYMYDKLILWVETTV